MVGRDRIIFKQLRFMIYYLEGPLLRGLKLKCEYALAAEPFTLWTLHVNTASALPSDCL